MQRLNKIDQKNSEKAAKQLWNTLRNEINYLSKEDQKLVELAFTEMVIAHGEDRRKSGDFYFIHPVAACLTLAKIHLDKDTLSAALLHDVPEDTDVTLKQLSKDFSKEIIFLIRGVTKFSVIKYKGEKRYAENLRKMFVAMSKDIRIIFIKLADRLHNLRTLKHVRSDKQKRIALESLEIYAPIAERLGMSKLRGEIEDAAFPFLYPEKYKEFVRISDLEINRRKKIADRLIKKTNKILEQNKIPYENIFGRAKKYYSIYKKLETKGKNLEEVYDLIALRIVTYSIDDCYQILSIIHNNFRPIEGRVKDYIANPKENGYRSIHTSVVDPDTNESFEFQIRTEEMHEYAEYGIAVHWVYKDGVEESELEKINPEHFKWISEIVDLGKQKMDETDYIKKVKLDLFNDRIFVMTPKGDVIDLQKGATALDFAFKVHEKVGQQATMVKINNKLTKLNTKLHNGDTVEIITDKKQKPNYEWINWVYTKLAKRKIRTKLRKDQLENDDS